MYKYREINPYWLSDTGNSSRESCESGKQTSAQQECIYRISSLEGNNSCIWKSMWFNQYITFFVTEHFKFISICFEVLRGLTVCVEASPQWIARKDIWKLNFWPPFCFEMGKVTFYWPLNRLWKGILHFTFTEISCPATGPGDLKFVTDSLPLFGLNETFLMANFEASMMWGDAMPHEMYEFTKKVSSTLLEKHNRLC